jgi:hypothetical protein
MLMLKLKSPSDPRVIEWLDRYTCEDTRYIRTRRSLAEAITCRVYRNKLGKEETLLFAIVGKRIRLVVTDGTVDSVREEFLNWREAIVFAKGVLAVYRQPYGGGMLTCQE